MEEFRYEIVSRLEEIPDSRVVKCSPKTGQAGMIGCLSDKGERNDKAEKLLARVQGRIAFAAFPNENTVAELSS